jgi:hypothetical protein
MNIRRAVVACNAGAPDRRESITPEMHERRPAAQDLLNVATRYHEPTLNHET